MSTSNGTVPRTIAEETVWVEEIAGEVIKTLGTGDGI
jgi:hypothetical protein